MVDPEPDAATMSKKREHTPAKPLIVRTIEFDPDDVLYAAADRLTFEVESAALFAETGEGMKLTGADCHSMYNLLLAPWNVNRFGPIILLLLSRNSGEETSVEDCKIE